MFNVSKNVLVTGSSGFIGFNLSQRLLNEGHKAVSYTHLRAHET